MKFSEAGQDQGAIPPWVRYLIGLGGQWLGAPNGGRRIGLISMPCPSAAAALVVLGAICQRLTIDGANDLRAHFDRIRDLALRGDASTFLRCGKKKAKFVPESVDQSGHVWVRQPDSDSGLRITLSPKTAAEWSIVGEAPMKLVAGAAMPFADFYSEIRGGDSCTVTANLALTDSAICLAGASAGASDTRARATAIVFSRQDQAADLAQLLTAQDWSPGTISRIAFFNTRTRQMDRETRAPALVVADGDKAFLCTLSHRGFEESDVIGVVDRTQERERLEEVRAAIDSKSQWYAPRHWAPLMDNTPRGIGFQLLQRS